MRELIKRYELALKLMEKQGCSERQLQGVREGIKSLKSLKRNLGLDLSKLDLSKLDLSNK